MLSSGALAQMTTRVRRYWDKTGDFGMHCSLARTYSSLKMYSIHPCVFGCDVALKIPPNARLSTDESECNLIVLDTPNTYIRMLLDPAKKRPKNHQIPVAFISSERGMDGWKREDLVINPVAQRLPIPFLYVQPLDQPSLRLIGDLAKLTHKNELVVIGLVCTLFGNKYIPKRITPEHLQRVQDIVAIKACSSDACCGFPRFGRRRGLLSPMAAYCEEHYKVEVLGEIPQPVEHTTVVLNDFWESIQIQTQTPLSLSVETCTQLWAKLVSFGKVSSKNDRTLRFVDGSYRTRLINAMIEIGSENCTQCDGSLLSGIFMFARKEDLVYKLNQRSVLFWYNCHEECTIHPNIKPSYTVQSIKLFNRFLQLAQPTPKDREDLEECVDMRQRTIATLHLQFVEHYKRSGGRLRKPAIKRSRSGSGSGFGSLVAAAESQ
jgi:hypothetical protein